MPFVGVGSSSGKLVEHLQDLEKNVQATPFASLQACAHLFSLSAALVTEEMIRGMFDDLGTSML